MTSATRRAALEQLADALAAVTLAHPTRVAIDGVDGVGKTTLADELAGRFAASRRHVVRASVDGFHNARSVRYRLGADSPAGYFLDSFDYPALRKELLEPLGPNGSLRFRRSVFDHRSDRPVDLGRETARADAILLFDGVFLQRPELDGLWDVRVWVDAPFDVTVARAVARDAAADGEAGQIRPRYERRYVPGQHLYINECRPAERADIIVDNADPDEPRVHDRRSGPAR